MGLLSFLITYIGTSKIFLFFFFLPAPKKFSYPWLKWNKETEWGSIDWNTKRFVCCLLSRWRFRQHRRTKEPAAASGQAWASFARYEELEETAGNAGSEGGGRRLWLSSRGGRGRSHGAAATTTQRRRDKPPRSRNRGPDPAEVDAPPGSRQVTSSPKDTLSPFSFSGHLFLFFDNYNTRFKIQGSGLQSS